MGTTEEFAGEQAHTGDALFSELMLRSGAVLRNRIVKAAMEEGLAAAGQLPGDELISLYRRWGQGGAGALITGNVMVHAEAMTGPADVVLDDRQPLEPFARWAQAAKSGGAAVWMQISHPGRQVQGNMPGVTWAPSAVAMDLGKLSSRFKTPTAMTAQQIENTVARFRTTAMLAERAGFDGIEVHAAHGYLISQFLSPLVNKREDQWGGSLANRARLLLDVVSEIRGAVRPGFVVAVKLNSADFQRGGFDAGDAQQVIELLAPLGVDLVEISGGSYESPAMSGRPAETAGVAGTAASSHPGGKLRASTVAREAYFLELAAELARTSPLPLMLTGGITRRETAAGVLASGVPVIGIATALALNPELPDLWKAGRSADVKLQPVSWSNKALASAASLAMVTSQMARIAHGQDPATNTRAIPTLLAAQLHHARAIRRYRSWLQSRG